MFSLFPKRFTPLESAVLKALGDNLTPEAAQILRRQLDLVRRTDRLLNDTEIEYRYGKSTRDDPAFAFPNAAVELKLERMDFRCPSVEGKWKAEFWLVSGHFFIINFRPGAKNIRNVDRIEVTSFELLSDPMVSSTKPGGTPEIPVPHEIAVWCSPTLLGRVNTILRFYAKMMAWKSLRLNMNASLIVCPGRGAMSVCRT